LVRCAVLLCPPDCLLNIERVRAVIIIRLIRVIRAIIESVLGKKCDFLAAPVRRCTPWKTGLGLKYWVRTERLG
jgi:hypothetical protein